MRKITLRQRLAGGAAAGALAMALGAPAWGEQATYSFNQPSMAMAAALQSVGHQTGVNILVDSRLVAGMRAPELKGDLSPDAALMALLDGSGLIAQQTAKGTVLIRRLEPDPQGGSAEGGGAEVEALIVTAQKREEDIQDVPIAMSAFSQETLERTQIAGGPDLMAQVPNMTFTKTNFSSYSVQIRGIGTQAISATVDPAVAVAFNNTPFIRNRFFEQEFYDLQRIEVLRGPQGTLYGRNATAGVINILSARPKPIFEAKLSADAANYNSTRLEGMVNLPLVEDKVAVRLAGAWTRRAGYSTNQTTGEQIDGRDLWSGRVTLGFEPTEGLSAYLTYEHFEESDDRLRSGKQLCKKDVTPAFIGNVPIPLPSPSSDTVSAVNYIGQGCLGASLYSPEAFQTPNGYTLPYYGQPARAGLPVFPGRDPYARAAQSRDLRVIESTYEPDYKAHADIAHLQVNIDVAPALTLTSETAYGTDFSWSTQDYNRFTTVGGAFNPDSLLLSAGNALFDENGVFCDPQVGCSDTLTLADLATSKSSQFSQEFRISSDFDGSLNFSAGVNYLRHDAVDKYYLFGNTLTLFAVTPYAGTSGFGTGPWVAGVTDNANCAYSQLPGDPNQIYNVRGEQCAYIDPNPLESLNDRGHNYFLSKNPYKLISYAAFGELYYRITPALKLTAGLRFTVDKKHAPKIPSWLLAPGSGSVVAEVIDQEWREPTGRLTLDWKPQLSFTDETLLYASYAHGYKAGGANPPPPVVTDYAGMIAPDVRDRDLVAAQLLTHPKTFEPEFVDAFEIGAKNTLFEGQATFNINAFYYDYRGYQISQIVNRAAVNLNLDSQVWGAELEADWRPLENLRFGLKGGYEHTKLADGTRLIDLMDRTAGNTDFIVVKPFATIPSNCIVPVAWVEARYAEHPEYGVPLGDATCSIYLTGKPEEFGLGDTPNNGQGIEKDISGNELPNAPHFTGTLTADYTLPLRHDWLMTLHTDLYYQSEAWTRVFNTEGYDKLKAYTNVNLAAIFNNDDAGWQVMAYVKNVFDRDSITGAFLNSDDSGLTTNVFLTEPRLYGLRVTKKWTGGSFWNVAGRSSSAPYPLVVEVGGGPLRIDAPNASYRPGFADEVEARGLAVYSNDVPKLDWGDSREVKLAYRPGASPWLISLGVRHGETNSYSSDQDVEDLKGGRFLSDDIIERYPFLESIDRYYDNILTNYSRVESAAREEHTFVDFAVGRDIGMGEGFASQIQAGLKYAAFKSSNRSTLDAIADRKDFPEENVFKYTSVGSFESRHNTVALAVERDAKLFGPALSWDASKDLLGGGESGLVSAEVGLNVGVLFGQQETSVEIDSFETLRSVSPSGFTLPVSVTHAPQLVRRETHSVTVPALGANIGLSYEVGRMKVSGGYRIDKFYDVLDGGLEERKSVDRTIDGPYFKIAVGFGG